jgi:hypothetical protein
MRWQPFVTLLIGSLFIGFVIFASIPSQPSLSFIQDKYPNASMKQISFMNGLLYWTLDYLEKDLVSVQLYYNNSQFDTSFQGTLNNVISDKDRLFVLYYTTLEESISYKARYYRLDMRNAGGNLLEYDTKIHGNLGFSKSILTHDNQLLYIRKLDFIFDSRSKDRRFSWSYSSLCISRI